MARAGRVLPVLAGLLVLQLGPSAPAPPTLTPPPAAGALRAFSADSPWNAALPDDVPLHPRSGEVLELLAESSVRDGCILLAGAEEDPWGTPVYWAGAGDREHHVRSTRYPLPPEFRSLRIPAGARPMKARDRELVVFDVERGTVAWLSRAERSPWGGWTAAGGSIAHLRSDGLAAELGGHPGNTGTQRGLNGAVVAVRHDEVAAGALRHALRVGVPVAGSASVWPMTGSDGTSGHPDAPPQGTRLRLRPDVDVASYGLRPEAQVIARALQEHGLVVGDSTGAGLELKLEDTVRQGRGQLWRLRRDELCSIPLEDFQVLAPGERTSP